MSGAFSICLLGSLALVASCGPLRRGPERAQPEEDQPDDVSSTKGATIITGRALQDGPGALLRAIANKVPNMRIQQRAGQPCPEIILRSVVNFQGIVNPHVYVDGTRASDTCILESLRSSDVARVEVYPLGFTTRPGYATHAHGLILVFMRSS
jgi:hypothetical protein